MKFGILLSIVGIIVLVSEDLTSHMFFDAGTLCPFAHWTQYPAQEYKQQFMLQVRSKLFDSKDSQVDSPAKVAVMKSDDACPGED